MANHTEQYLKGLGEIVKEIAGEKAQKQVMEDADKAAKTTSKENISMWIKEAVGRMDACTTPAKCAEIMGACGRSCYAKHAKMVAGYKTRRMKFKTEAEFLQAETKRTVKNCRIELEGNKLIQYYTPRRMKSNVRCFCGLINHLPESDNVSPTYCQCSRAFIQAQWENALGRPLRVEVKETAITGADKCKFIIHL